MNFITLPDIGKRIPLLEVSSIELFTCAHWAPDGKSATCDGPLSSWHYNFGDFGSRDNTYLMKFLAPAVEPRLIMAM